MSDTPGTPNAAYREQEAAWKLVDDVLEGTKAIRLGGERYTPRAIGEEEERYEKRLQQSRFYNLYRHVLDGLVGRVFRRPPVIAADGSPTLRAHAEDITGTGVHLSVFARRLFRWSVHHGHDAILIEAPREQRLGRRATIADVRRLGIRPYWVLVKAPQILDFAVTYEGGLEVIQSVTLKEAGTEREGRFGEKPYVQYRVLEMRGGTPTFEVWREEKGGTVLRPDLSGEYQGIDQIPLVPCYAGEPLGAFRSFPTLYDVAEANLDHYAVQTRHSYNESVASNPIPVIKNDGPITDPIPISVEHGIRLSANGDAYWMEHSGGALTQTRESMRDLEQRIGILGMLATVARRTNQAETAEAKRIDAMEGEARIAAWARGLQDALEQGCVLHARMIGEEAPSVTINLDFDGLTMTPDQFRATVEGWERGAYTIETLWAMLAQGGVLPEGFNPEKEGRALTETLPTIPDDEEDASEDDQRKAA